MKTSLVVLVSTIAILLGFPPKAKAEWYPIADAEQGTVYMNDKSVMVKGSQRSAEVRYEEFGRAMFIVNCNTNTYYFQSNQGQDEGYAVPGTVGGIVLEEVCENYQPE
jgi:hypothetical protein